MAIVNNVTIETEQRRNLGDFQHRVEKVVLSITMGDGDVLGDVLRKHQNIIDLHIAEALGYTQAAVEEPKPTAKAKGKPKPEPKPEPAPEPEPKGVDFAAMIAEEAAADPVPEPEATPTPEPEAAPEATAEGDMDDAAFSATVARLTSGDDRAVVIARMTAINREYGVKFGREIPAGKRREYIARLVKGA